MTDAPLVSVVIPVWNRRERVLESIRSLELPKACGAAEAIVVDDGSTDDTAEVVAAMVAAEGLAPFIRVERQANAGPAAARNRGAALARGAWLAFLDSDDRWFPWTLPLLLEALRDRNEPAMALMRTVDATPVDLDRPRGSETLRIDCYETYLHAFMAMRNTSKTVVTGSCNLVMARALFERIGGFDPALWHSEDIELFLRTHPAPCLILDQPPMLRYERGAGGNLTHNIANFARAVAVIDARHHRPRVARFGDDAPKMEEYFSGIVLYATRLAFAQGHPVAAYRLIFTQMRSLVGGAQRRWGLVARLLATPAMAVLRPRGYAFRLWPAPR